MSIRLDGADLPATYLSAPDGRGLRQINALLPPQLEPREYLVTVACRGEESPPAAVHLTA